MLESVENLLKATEHTLIATGVLNLWMHDPAHVAATYAELRAAHSDRFLLGIGVSQAAVVDAHGTRPVPETAGRDAHVP